eukprot:CAMPEP_0176425582 /NCGR_PEP_ID=MMETSP0127-20121128/11467_1 /TAXON_ID=938130 /ORGANISM="Platyophrya macrostoma, Strain WH" /LENGTH=883 /DNA_ID=CAMNT_0017806755 /DNA_START=34 /DNA_END=2685 /DNA_ORIENTATION=+
MIDKEGDTEEGFNIFRRSVEKRNTFSSGNKLYRPEFSSTGDLKSKERNDKLWALMNEYLNADPETIEKNIVDHLEYTLAVTRFDFNKSACYKAAAYTIRDRLIESWNDTQQHITSADPKRIYYLSLEFLLGRAMQNALINMDIEEPYKKALKELGYALEDLYTEEVDPGLGNGGLGRLAACFLDSMATLDYPAWGYGIRYNYGIFKQLIVDSGQVEIPDYWLEKGNPWELKRNDVKYPVRFYGKVNKRYELGKEISVWEDGETILAVANDNPVPGYGTFNTVNLRLWQSAPTNEFDFSSFNQGDYFKALEARQRAEYISSVLYPNDSTPGGKELRLKQQYFFVSASIKDILRRFLKKKRDWSELPGKVAIQLNDTHPALGIVELLRILIDDNNIEWEKAWAIVYKTFGYTNHTVMPEALEKWPVDLLEVLLPRHLELIYLINFYFINKIKDKFAGDGAKLSRLSLVEESTPKKIRMANLCILGSHAVNGVAALHSELLIKDLFKDFYELFPKKFQNKTNGVTPRRWIACCNPELAKLYSEYLKSDDWLANLDKIKSLKEYAADPTFQKRWLEIKRNNKKRLIQWVQKNCNVTLNEDSLFDIMFKRIHEYKRQFMNALYLIHRYLKIKDTPIEERKKWVPRTVLFGGKAAPGYLNAKKIIRLIGAISNVVNNDKEIGDLLKVVFLPNYNVSLAEIVIPASEVSHHISTAGFEASGTSNMKFCLNGCLLLGTMDGANVEIAEEIGDENLFIFGARVHDIDKASARMKHLKPEEYFGPELGRVFQAIDDGMFGFKDELKSLLDTIRFNNDFYLIGHDFGMFVEAQDKVDQLYKNQSEWVKKSILTATGCSKFSSDRTIMQYAKDIWDIKPVTIPKPSLQPETRQIL